MEIIKLQEEKLVINPDDPDLCHSVERFLSECDIGAENIPVTIIVDPPISMVTEDVNQLSEILIELYEGYVTEGNYLLELHMSSIGIVVTFRIEHTATTFSHEIGHC